MVRLLVTAVCGLLCLTLAAPGAATAGSTAPGLAAESAILSPANLQKLYQDDDLRPVRFRLVDEPAGTYDLYVYWGDDGIDDVAVRHPGGTATYTRRIEEAGTTGYHDLEIWRRGDDGREFVTSSRYEVVEAPDPYVVRVTAAPRTFDPGAARKSRRATTLRVLAYESQTVRLVVRRGADRSVVRRLTRLVRREVATFRWDGRDASGTRQPGGTYVVRAVATSRYGTTADRRTTVRLLPR